jgi:hypothetical protein
MAWLLSVPGTRDSDDSRSKLSREKNRCARVRVGVLGFPCAHQIIYRRRSRIYLFTSIKDFVETGSKSISIRQVFKKINLQQVISGHWYQQRSRLRPGSECCIVFRLRKQHRIEEIQIWQSSSYWCFRHRSTFPNTPTRHCQIKGTRSEKSKSKLISWWYLTWRPRQKYFHMKKTSIHVYMCFVGKRQRISYSGESLDCIDNLEKNISTTRRANRTTRRKIFWLLRLQHHRLRLATLGGLPSRTRALSATLGGSTSTCPWVRNLILKTCDFVDISNATIPTALGGSTTTSPLIVIVILRQQLDYVIIDYAAPVTTHFCKLRKKKLVGLGCVNFGSNKNFYSFVAWLLYLCLCHSHCLLCLYYGDLWWCTLVDLLI